MIIAKRMPRIVRSILFRTFVQGESRSQVYLDYAEPPPKVHLYERLFHNCAEQNNGLLARPNHIQNVVLSLKNWFLFSPLTNINYRGGVKLKTFCIFAANFWFCQYCLLIELALWIKIKPEKQARKPLPLAYPRIHLNNPSIK